MANKQHRFAKVKIMKFDKILRILAAFSILLVWGCHSDHQSHDEDHDHDHGEVAEESSHHHEGLAIEPEQATEFGIEYETVEPVEFHDVIKTWGEVSVSTSDTYTVSAKKSGIVRLAEGVSQGVGVKAGGNLGSISAQGVQGGDVNQAAKANLEAARKEYERLKPLHEEGLVTTSQFREAERAYNEATALAGKGEGGSSSLSTPMEGNILQLYVKSGDYVDVGAPIAQIGKSSNLMLTAYLPTREVKHLNELETANIFLEGGSELIKLSDHNGRKTSGNHTSTASNGYIPVYFTFDGDGAMHPGYAEVFLVCGSKENSLSVPRDALIEVQGNKYVYVKEGDHDYEKRAVATGASDGERIEITAGLYPGETVVSKGASIVRMVEISSIAPPAHTHNH